MEIKKGNGIGEEKKLIEIEQRSFGKKSCSIGISIGYLWDADNRGNK